jgi:microcystin degradation protein MlrC
VADRPGALRVAIVGLHLEASTFAQHLTREEDFTILRGRELVDNFVAEWRDEPWLAARDRPVEWVPVLHAQRTASAPIDPVFWRRALGEIREVLTAAGPVDGVYLPIHGAAAVLGQDGAEEQLVRLVREVVGPEAVLSASMDPHGNMSRELAGLLDLMTCHRFSPHTDNARSRERAVRNLLTVLDRGERPVTAWARVPVLLPGERTSTDVEPGASVFGAVEPIAAEHDVLDAALFMGFAWADEARCHGTAVAVGWDADDALRCAERIARGYWDARERFDLVVDATGSIDQAIDAALAGAPGGAPLLVSDSGDNVTAGGSGDLTVALGALVERSAELGDRRALVAGLTDPAAVRLAASLGIGGSFRAALGAGDDARFAGPVPGEWTVARLIGPEREPAAALLEGPVDVIVQTARTPFVAPGDPGYPAGLIRTPIWIEPSGYDVVVVKNGYLFPTQAEAAGSRFLAITPGPTDLDMDRLGYHRLQRPLFPFDRETAVDLTPVLLAHQP